jgi:dienelactone hydrolase
MATKVKVGPLLGLLSTAGAVVAVSAVSQGAFSLPKPSGAFAVGMRTVQVAHESPDPPGEFPVTVWYPATPSGDRAPYGLAGESIKNVLLRHVLHTQAARNAALAGGDRHFPVLVYVASWNGSRTENTALAEDLASHGFIVIALDDISRDVPTMPAVVGPLDISSDRAFLATLSLASRKLAHGSRRVSTVLNRAFAVNGPFGEALRKRMDPLRVGAIGYSFGGAVAFESAQHDRRIGCVVNLDGWLFRDPQVAPVRRVPYLSVGTDDPPTSQADLSSADPEHRAASVLNSNDERFAREQSDGNAAVFITVRGSEHASFRDDVDYAIVRRTKRAVAPQQILRLLSSYTVPFFERTLNVQGRRASGSKVSTLRRFLADSGASSDGVYLSDS